MDALVGGAFPLGSLIGVVEQQQPTLLSPLASTLLNSAAVRGLSSGQLVTVAAPDLSASAISRELMQQAKATSATGSSRLKSTTTADAPAMDVAWRYNDAPLVNSEVKASGEHFKCNEPFSTEKLQILSGIDEKYTGSQQVLSGVEALFGNNCAQRVCIHRLDDPLWRQGRKIDEISFFQTVFRLRLLLRRLRSIGIVSFSMGHDDAAAMARLSRLVDCLLCFKNIGDTPGMIEHDAMLSLCKAPHINSLKPCVIGGDTDYGVKLKRRCLVVERLHLPPELDETKQREQDDTANLNAPQSACSSGMERGPLSF